MDFNKIIDKHNYSKEMASFLKQVYDEFVLYYGSEYEKVIYMAFYEVPIISVENIYDGLIENGLFVQYDGSMVSDGDLKRASGCYSSNAIEKSENGSYVIDKINRGVLIYKLDLSQDQLKCVLIHELGHLVNSYMNEYHIDGNLKINRTGLRETIVKIDDLGKYSLVSEKGNGLEEGLNTLLEENVACNLVDANYKTSGYPVSCVVAKRFLELIDKDIVFYAQLYGQKGRLVDMFDQKYGPGAYEEYESMADKICSLELEMSSHKFDNAKMQESTKKLKEAIEKDFKPLVVEFLNRQKNSGGRNA